VFCRSVLSPLLAEDHPCAACHPREVKGFANGPMIRSLPTGGVKPTVCSYQVDPGKLNRLTRAVAGQPTAGFRPNAAKTGSLTLRKDTLSVPTK